MRRRFLTALVFVCAGMLSGCHIDGKLYPVQGPLAAQAQPPIFAARITGGLKSGELSATLANNELCKGTWAQLSNAPTQGSNTAGSGGTSQNMPAAWDAVYGKGFYAAQVLGQHVYIHGTMSGDHGTTLTVEAYRVLNSTPNAPAGTVLGVAADNNGNIYKIAF